MSSSKRDRLVRLAACALAAAACAPNLGQPATATSRQAVAPPKVAIQGAQVGADRKVAVTYRLSAGEAGLAGDAAAALRPAFTLAALSTDPVSGIAAWRSHLLTGRQAIASLPISGPGTPPEHVLAGTKQPGVDVGGTAEELGDGIHRYTFGTALPEGYDATETLRVGLWLAGVATGTMDTNATFDFVPAGGTPRALETVLDANCAVCHGAPKSAHGTQVGVRVCVTCHTYQNADPDTVDPAAMAGATPATNPNPLDLGRLVHRIHRGPTLPTLYQSSSSAPAPGLPSAPPLPLPFSPARNTPIAGASYTIVTDQGRIFTPGKIVGRTDNGQPARSVPTGVLFPRDLRECAACHGGAPQESVTTQVISRRTCGGCHPDVWFGAGGTDAGHLAHPGGPKADDTACAACHASGTGAYAPIADVHVPPYLHANYNKLTARIVAVTGMLPGSSPTVSFTLSDRDGPITSLLAPTPPNDARSPVPRKLTILRVTIGGPAETDYTSGANSPRQETLPDQTISDANGVFSYKLATALPADASGTWAIGLEGRRAATPALYDAASDRFNWPYTGETVTEIFDNPVAFVDTATGVGPDGDAVARRAIVDVDAKCNRCHGRLMPHPGRTQTQYCVLCHARDATDWSRRPKDASGNTALAATYDGIEERAIHFKVHIHRIHTGRRTGSAELDIGTPFVSYSGSTAKPNFLDGVLFPNELANCTLCHVGKSYEVEAIPANAMPTIANETGTIRHASTSAHAADEPRILPILASCIGCHDTPTATLHASKYVAAGVETCATCHGAKGGLSVRAAHRLPAG